MSRQTYSTFLLIALLPSFASGQTVDAPAGLFSQWRYFSPLTLHCQPWDITVEVNADFTRLLRESKVSGALDKNSIRVVEIGTPGFSETETPSLFLRDSNFDPVSNAKGRVRVRVRKGAVSRSYRVYFDTIENGEKPLIDYGELQQEPNWIDNGGFERVGKDSTSPIRIRMEQGDRRGADGWGLPRRCGATLDDSVAHSGNRSIRLLSPVRGQTASLAIPGAGPLLVDPGERYQLTLWSKAQDLDDPSTILSAYWYDAERKYINHEKLDNLSMRSGVASHSWDWASSTEILLTPPQAHWVRIFIATCSTGGPLWIDDVSILPVNPPDLKELQIQNQSQEAPPYPQVEGPQVR